MEKKISVIVTVHNAQKYIKECMDSVIQQTFSDIEILCIDGGSTDKSSEILKEYEQKDSRIRIINDSNTSYGHKINRGIDEAMGEYVSVLESDDMYESFMLEELYGIAQKYHPDVVNGNYTCFYDVNGKRISYEKKMYEANDYNKLIEISKHPNPLGNITRYWTGIFSRDFLRRTNLKMNESPGASYQDMSFRFLTSILAASVYHLDLPVYLYRVDNPNSSIFDTTKTVVIAEEHNFLKNELKKRGITDEYIWHNAYKWKYSDFRGNMLHLKANYRRELFDRYREELEKDEKALKKYRKEGFGEYVEVMLTTSAEEMWSIIEAEIQSVSERKEKQYKLMEKLTVLEKQQIVLFGCGIRGKYIMEQLGFLYSQIGCVTDNSELLWGKNFMGVIVLPPEEAVKKYAKACYIVANKKNANDICKQLQAYGIQDIIVY